MDAEGELDYALARVHARQSHRLDETAWRRLEMSHDLGQYLDSARTGPLAGWVASLDPTRDTHAIERLLRIEWRQYVTGIASWHPEAWQAWIAWWTWLPYLSLLGQLSRPGPAPAWMLADPVCGPVATGSPAERAAAAQMTALAPLGAAILGLVPMHTAWLERWSALQPMSGVQTRQRLSLFLRALDRHFSALNDESANTPQLRKQLSGQLTRMFHASGGSVIATLCHLSLMALDLERLRGGLASRSAGGTRLAEVA